MSTTKVIFRRWRDTGEIIAYFPEVEEHDGSIMSYMHVGQHGGATYPNSGTAAATAEEYAPLQRELESIGYQLRVMKRARRNPLTIKR